jgi:hypothetical protein
MLNWFRGLFFSTKRREQPGPCRPDDELCHELRNAVVALQADRKLILSEVSAMIQAHEKQTRTIERIGKFALNLKTHMQRIETALSKRQEKDGQDNAG